MTDAFAALQATDPEVHALCQAEDDRQRRVIRLIASENYTSRAVMEASASTFTNKYSEGYPHKRYYQGQQYTDAVEVLACERGKALFGCEHINVQPYSGSPANMAVYLGLAKPGATILGMGLPAGGHLTHGWKVNFSGQYYASHAYGLDAATERIDMAEVRRLAHDVRPRLLICGASAYPRLIDFEAFAEIAREVGALLVADIAHISGLVAGGMHPSPVGVADVVTSTTHKTLRGPRSGMIMCKAEFAKDIDRAVFPGLQGGPHMHTIAALAVAFHEALQPEFKHYARQVVDNARAMGEAFLAHGYRLVTGGTDNHLLLVDLSDIGGKPVGQALDQAGIVANANSIPFDRRKPFDPSGVRIGTAAVTTRGMGPDEMQQIVRWIDRVVKNLGDTTVLEGVRREVEELCSHFPAP